MSTTDDTNLAKSRKATLQNRGGANLVHASYSKPMRSTTRGPKCTHGAPHGPRAFLSLQEVQNHRPARRMRDQSRIMVLPCAVAVLVVVALSLLSQRFQYEVFSQFQLTQPAPSSNANNRKGRRPRSSPSDPKLTQGVASLGSPSLLSGGTSPLASVPPPSIPLFQTTDPAILNRHKCIQAIRNRHQAVLGPLVQPAATMGDGSILLVDPAYHENVGDHMITLGELEFLRRLGVERSQIRQCSYIQAGSHVPPCEPSSNASLPESPTGGEAPKITKVALWHGGGNWGDVWKTVQPRRIASFSWLLRENYSVVGMPQSLFYSHLTLAESDAALLKQSVAKGLGSSAFGLEDPGNGQLRDKNRVHLAWREYESYEQAKELYPFVTNILVPDIAFQLGPYQALPPPRGSVLDMDLVVFMRSDHESVLSQYRDKSAVKKVLESIPGAERLKFMIVDWFDRLELFDSQDPFFTVTSIQLLSMGRVVICDRLHAAILCYLAGLPFVYVDQLTGKISKALRVAFDSWEECQDGDSASWAGAKSFPSAVEIAISFLGKLTSGRSNAT